MYLALSFRSQYKRYEFFRLSDESGDEVQSVFKLVKDTVLINYYLDELRCLTRPLFGEDAT